ncbi:Enzymatic polyprotein [Vitis vinifera]|uniref:Enzymatic polyprotein n=1 Tax=Vitis vinifera TaxID=29760 RepID=A0A438CP27_VITVI|nr:Enzymatic polyprotein [Vitis vinifera]
MQFEERNQYTQASYTSGTIYEWNIDGMTEYNILTKLQEMTMVSTTYKLNNRLPDHAVAQTIVAGFTGQLKGWWDNYLTFDDRNSILKAYRINENSEVVKDEDGQDIEDAVATLIYSISKHFIGDPAKIKDKTADLLTNLKCPKLHDFRWYKEVFLTKVMLRSDCNQSFWKEKFISGLPKLFSERIRIKIREQYNGQIPYDKLTYGEIISIVTAEGIKLCNDFKLKQQMKNEQKIYKNEFGSFCSQFGFSQKETMPPSKQKPIGSLAKISFTTVMLNSDSESRTDSDNEDDINQLDSSGEVSSQSSSDQANVLKVEAKKTVNPYNLNDILNRFDQQSPKEVSIKELHEEVKQYKKEIKVKTIHKFRVIFQRWEVSLTIVVKDKFVFDIIALIDSGAAENCLQEGLVPIPLCEETSQSLFGANGKDLPLIKQYFLKNPTQVSASDDMSQFLLKKQQLQAMLAAAKTPQDFRKSLKKEAQAFPKKILMQSLMIQQATFQTMYKAACQKSSQPKEVFRGFRYKSESYYSLFKHGSTVHEPWEGSWVLFWVFWTYPRIGSSVPRSASPAVEPLLAVDRRLLGCKRVGVTSHKLEQDDQVIRLLDNRSIEKHKKDGYNFIHFGMIQVAAKPLTRLDHGFKIKPGNSPVSIITRFAYKSMNTSVGSGALCTSPKGETTTFTSDMLDNVLKVLNKLFNILMEEENWFSPTLSDIPAALEFLFMNPLELQALPSHTVPKVIRTIYQEEFYAYLRQEKKNIKFWIWFELFKQEEYPDYPCKRINNTSTKAKIWKTSDNIVIESIHPPEAKIEKNINGTIVTASPFKTKPEDKGTASATDIRRIMEQINYTNMFLITLGNQVNRVEEIIETQITLRSLLISQKVKDNLVIPETPQTFAIHETPLPSHRRILLVKRNISPKAKDNGLIRVGFYHSSPKKEDFEEVLESSQDNSDKINAYLNTISKVIFQRCSFELSTRRSCTYPIYEKTRQALFGANGKKLIIKYKLSNAHICNQGICIKQTFILVKDLKEKALLGVPFLSSIFPMWVDDQDSVEQHWKHLNRFLGHHIHQGTFTPIQRSIEFADKFPDEIKDKKQLQHFLGSLNYVSDFIQDLSQLCAPLRQRLKKNPVPWNEDHTKIVKIVKSRVKTLPCLALADHKAFKIVETMLRHRIHKIMAPKTEKQSFKKSSSYMKPHSVLSEKFKPLYYDFASGSTSDPNPSVLKHPSSPVVEEGNISGSLPLVEEPIPLDFSTFDTNPLSVHKSICDLQARNCTEPLLHQQDNKPICNCNRNFTISRACIDLQYYQPINLAFKEEVLILTPEKLLDYGLVYQLICSDPSQASNFGRKVNLSLTQGFKLNKKFADAIFISKAPEWISRGKILPAQHYVNLHYQNRRPTLLSSP